MEISLAQYLDQIHHCLEHLEEPGNADRTKEIASIRKQIETYQIGLQRVDTKQMVSAILASLEDLAPRIEALVQSDISVRPTWPAPAPDMEETPSVRP